MSSTTSEGHQASSYPGRWPGYQSNYLPAAAHPSEQHIEYPMNSGGRSVYSQNSAYQYSGYPAQNGYSSQYASASTYSQQPYNSPYSGSLPEPHHSSSTGRPAHSHVYAPYVLPKHHEDYKTGPTQYSQLRVVEPRSLGSPSPSTHSPINMSPMSVTMPYSSVPFDHRSPGAYSVASPISTTSTESRRSSVESGINMVTLATATPVQAALLAPNAHSRTVQANKPLNGNSTVEFNTVVDGLMKTIQEETASLSIKTSESSQPASEVLPVPNVGIPTSAQLHKPTARPSRRSRTRTMHYCQVEGCNRSFGQKSHLEIHLRAHTGEKPYTCSIDECGQKFSQLGNLRTHERLHTGKRPYACIQCGKSFAACGKLKSHIKAHSGNRSFVCKIDRCNKNFTQLGNLKAHQNKFHEATIQSLTQRFASMTPEDFKTLSEEDRQMLQYFSILYKNSNKGIKGRGKGRKVIIVRSPEPIRSTISFSQSSSRWPDEGRLAPQPMHAIPYLLPPPHPTHIMHHMQNLHQPLMSYGSVPLMRQGGMEQMPKPEDA